MATNGDLRRGADSAWRPGPGCRRARAARGAAAWRRAGSLPGHKARRIGGPPRQQRRRCDRYISDAEIGEVGAQGRGARPLRPVRKDGVHVSREQGPFQRKDGGCGGQQERAIAGFAAPEHGGKPGVHDGMKVRGRSAQTRAHRARDICSVWKGNHQLPVDRQSQFAGREVGLRVAQHRRRAERGPVAISSAEEIEPCANSPAPTQARARGRNRWHSGKPCFPSASGVAIRRDLRERTRRFRHGTKHTGLATSVHLCT